MGVHYVGGGCFAFSDFYEGTEVPPVSDCLISYMPMPKEEIADEGKDEKDLKKYRITVKCTESEKEEIKEAAKEAGMNVSEWMMTASRELKKIYDMVEKRRLKDEKREE